jgi:hypothetical protein
MAGKQVERFSSTARLDGIGDCEDIAKESALVFGDLIALNVSDRGALLGQLAARAKQFQFCICLTTVQRHNQGDLEAHAFGMLLPNSVFPNTMLTREEQDAETITPGNRVSYMCDGVYVCHPSKKKKRLSEFKGYADEQLAPWNYKHIVSAFVYGKGEVYFKEPGESLRYGVQADCLFPKVLEGVVVVNAHGPETTIEERAAAAKRVLASNIPRATRTFGNERYTSLQQFKSVVKSTPGRAKKIANIFSLDAAV